MSHETVCETRQHERGFTLVELMISLVLFSFAIAGILSVAVSVTQGYREQRQAIAAESSVRAPLDFLADALRQASPGVPDPSMMIDWQTCATGALSSAVVATTGNNTGLNSSDKLDLVYASGGVVTTTTTALSASSTTLTVVNAADLSAGDYIVITDLTYGVIVPITAVNSNTLTLGTKCSSLALPNTSYAKGSIVVRAQHATFYIANQTINGVSVPHLMMDPDSDNAASTAAAEPLAEYIDDMQIAYGVDTNSDKTITEVGTAADDDEWYYNYPGESGPPSGAKIRAVRVTLIARTSKALFGNASSIYFRPAAEDHAVGSSDSYRRRVLRTIVELRNITGSP